MSTPKHRRDSVSPSHYRRVVGAAKPSDRGESSWPFERFVRQLPLGYVTYQSLAPR
jgi:hypothetical protein